MVPQCNPGYTVLIGPPSHWLPNVILVIHFSLVPHVIGHPMESWLCSSHWSPILLVTQSNPGYTVVIGPQSHWSPNVILVLQFSLVLISLVTQCNPDYAVLIGPPPHWSPNVTLVLQFSLVPHLISYTM